MYNSVVFKLFGVKLKLIKCRQNMVENTLPILNRHTKYYITHSIIFKC